MRSGGLRPYPSASSFLSTMNCVGGIWGGTLAAGCIKRPTIEARHSLLLLLPRKVHWWNPEKIEKAQYCRSSFQVPGGLFSTTVLAEVKLPKNWIEIIQKISVSKQKKDNRFMWQVLSASRAKTNTRVCKYEDRFVYTDCNIFNVIIYTSILQTNCAQEIIKRLLKISIFFIQNNHPLR